MREQQMRLILHAGTHKTGTTSIQHVLAHNRDWLRERGLIYPDGRAVFGEKKHYPFFDALTGTDRHGLRKAAAFLDEARRLASPSEAIIIASETAYRHIDGYNDWKHFTSPDYWPRRQRYLARTAEVLSDFDVEVLLFFRARDSFAESLYKEVIKKNYWRGDFLAFLIHFAPWFDYDRQIGAFQNAFGTVRIKSYEAATRAGLIDSFFSTIGFPAPPGAGEVWKRRTLANGCLWPSPESRATFLARYGVTAEATSVALSLLALLSA
jgi:hypothetical protein